MFFSRSLIDEHRCGDDVTKDTIESHLLRYGCLCQLPADVYSQTFSRHRDRRVVAVRADKIEYLSAIRLLLSTLRRQTDFGPRCPTVDVACSTLLADTTWFDYMLDQLSSVASDSYVVHVATCVTSEAALCCTRRRLISVTDELLLAITVSERCRPSCAVALNVFARVLNGRELERTLLLDRLHDSWTDVVNTIVGCEDKDRNKCLVELVRLWKSVFAWSSAVACRQRFYSALSSIQCLLCRTDTDRYMWLDTVRLFSAGLRGPAGTTLPGFASAIAEQITTDVNRLLYFMGKIRNGFGRECDQARVVQETVLLAMRSLRVFVMSGRRCDDDAVDTITDVVHRFDSFVKSSAMYAVDVPFCRWIVRLMCDRDDAVIECLICSLDVAIVLPAVWPLFDPFDGFVEFLVCVSFDQDVLLDYLISDENDFLPYVLHVLKTVCRDVRLFFRSCGHRLQDTMGLLIRLRLKILRLRRNNVFPYNIGPIAKLIERCDKSYSEIMSADF